MLRLHTFELLTCLFTWIPFYNFGSHTCIFSVVSFSFQSQLIPNLLSLLNGSGQIYARFITTLEYVYAEILGSTINSYCVGSAQGCDVLMMQLFGITSIKTYINLIQSTLPVNTETVTHLTLLI